MDNLHFDVFVIGSGIAGQTVAKTCVKEGLAVAIADVREFGGTCANRGCDPKKVLLGATEVLEMASHLSGKGIETQPTLNWKKLQKFKKQFVKKIPGNTEKDLKNLGITLFHQSPVFINENTLSVEGKTLTASKIVIASGYTTRELTTKKGNSLPTSDDFLNLKKLPKHIVFVGAGYIGMEFAHMAARAGVKVSVIERAERPLEKYDADLVSELLNYSKKLGIEFLLNSKVVAIKKKKKKYHVQYENNGVAKKIKAKLVINSSGRVPAVAHLDLEKGNISYNENGIKVNDYLQNPGNKNVYACGDVSDHSLPLTPLSGREGYVVSQNILKGNKKKIDIPNIPSVVFTLPNLAAVGLSEAEAKKRYKSVIVHTDSIANWYNAKRINTPIYSYKTILNGRTGRIVGAHLLGPNAAETINLFAMAINHRMTSDDLQRMIFTYPSWANDIKSMV